METIQAGKRGRPAEHDVEDDDEFYVTRMPSSTRRYRSAPPPKQVITDEPDTQQTGTIQRRRSGLNTQRPGGITTSAIPSFEMRTPSSVRRFPVVAVLVGVVLTIVLLMSLSALGSWWRGYQDDIQYGRPRTFQLDAVVGHSDSTSNKTHFIFLNLNKHIEIIEMPGGDATHAHIFMGPILYGEGQDLTPVTGEVRDVNGDGKPDLIVHIQNEQMVFLNDGTTFKLQ